MKKRTIVVGGGTFSPISTHLSLAAPAFGNTARTIYSLLKSRMIDSELILTDMASDGICPRDIRTNDDVKRVVDELLEDDSVGIIVMNVAFCDFFYPNGDRHGNRFKTEDGPSPSPWSRIMTRYSTQ